MFSFWGKWRKRALRRGGFTYSHNIISIYHPKWWFFGEDQKCSWGPKMKSKPNFFFDNRVFPNWGGAAAWEFFPHNPVFFSDNDPNYGMCYFNKNTHVCHCFAFLRLKHVFTEPCLTSVQWKLKLQIWFNKNCFWIFAIQNANCTLFQLPLAVWPLVMFPLTPTSHKLASHCGLSS